MTFEGYLKEYEEDRQEARKKTLDRYHTETRMLQRVIDNSQKQFKTGFSLTSVILKNEVTNNPKP